MNVISEIDTTVASIGDQIQWSIKVVSTKKDIQLEFPELIVKNDTFTVISQRSIMNNDKIIGKSFKIAFWETGKILTPPYFIKVIDNKANLIAVERLLIHVKSVLEANDSIMVRPIKSPVEVSRVVPYEVISKVIIIIIFIYLSVIVWRKRQVEKVGKKESIFHANPFQIAKNRIIALKTTGFTKDFYTELSHITRQFIENSYYLNALEMTTEEIKDSKNIFSVNENVFYRWVKFLEKADLIKYAKFEVHISDMEQDKKKAMEIIEDFLIK